MRRVGEEGCLGVVVEKIGLSGSRMLMRRDVYVC